MGCLWLVMVLGTITPIFSKLNCTHLDIDGCLEDKGAADCAWCDNAEDETHLNGTCIYYEGECGSLINGHPGEFDNSALCPGGHITRSEYNVCKDAVYFAKYSLFLGSILCAAAGIVMWVGSMLFLRFRRPFGSELQKWIRLFTWRVHVYMMFVSFVWTFCLLLIGFVIAAALDLNGSTPAVLLGTFAAYVVIKEFGHVIYTVLAHVEKGRLRVDGLAMNASAICYFIVSIYFAIAYQPFVFNEVEEIRLVALLDSIIVMFSFICRELLADGAITYAKNYVKATTDVVSGAPSRAIQHQIDQIQSKQRAGTLDDFDDPETQSKHGHEEVEDDSWPHATPSKKKLNQFVRILDFGFMIAIIVELALVFQNKPENILDTEKVVASARRAYILAFLSLARTWLVETQHSYGEQRWLAGKKFQFHYTEVGEAGGHGQGRSVLLEVGSKNDEQVWSQLSEQLIPDNEKHGYH